MAFRRSKDRKPVPHEMAKEMVQSFKWNLCRLKYAMPQVHEVDWAHLRRAIT